MKEYLSLDEFDYTLPEICIAPYPLDERDQSRLLLYNKGKISHHIFREISDLLPKDNLLVRNETKVIPARLFFKRESGAIIEIFCLNPVEPYTEISKAMQVTGSAVWKCMVGGIKKWKSGETIYCRIESVEIRAELISREERTAQIRFTWNPEAMNFAEILELSGSIPLPPYLNRDAEEKDSTSYQTVFAREQGAVAAPTAGLHFTEFVLRALDMNGIAIADITLHVSAGTFQPVEHDNALEHPMHSEEIIISRETIERICSHQGKVIALGTTSMRALESLYWLGCQILEGDHGLLVSQFAYMEAKSIDVSESLDSVLRYMASHGSDRVVFRSEIMIVPGYDFKICKGLITNFHQPKSTLLMLICAFIGENWKKVYAEALSNEYRFLSYGDSSMLIP